MGKRTEYIFTCDRNRVCGTKPVTKTTEPMPGRWRMVDSRMLCEPCWRAFEEFLNPPEGYVVKNAAGNVVCIVDDWHPGQDHEPGTP